MEKNLASVANKRICICVLTNSVSGTERVAADLCLHLISVGAKVSLVIPEGDSLDLYAEHLSSIGAAVTRIAPIAGDKISSLNPANFLQALRHFQRYNPDVIHFHCPSFKWGLEVICAAALRRHRIVRTEHNPLMSRPSFPYLQAIRTIDRSITRFTYVSEGNQARWESYLPKRRNRGTVVHNSVAVGSFGRADESARAAFRAEYSLPASTKLAIGVVSGRYGRRPVSPLIEALSKLRQDPSTTNIAKQWELFLVGDTKEIYEKGAEKLSFVHPLGYRNDIPRLFGLCDLFVGASHFEGLSISMLEAWASGLPVLSTKVDGIEDVIGTNLARVAMAAHGDVGAFAEKWYNFMSDRQIGDQQVVLASAVVSKDFLLSAMLGKYLSIYCDLISAKQ
ncbi:MAG: glycosyltransferase family 4 protein [Armatimonadota bacterium]